MDVIKPNPEARKLSERSIPWDPRKRVRSDTTDCPGEGG